MNLADMLLSMRMARRDALRAKGRSALVITLIALPIASVTAFTVLDSAFDSGQNTTRSLGAAEAELAWDYTSPLLQDPTARDWVEPVDDSLVKREEPAGTADVLALLPKGSTAIDTTTEVFDVVTPDGVTHINATGVDLTEPLAADRYTILDGTLPESGEVAISQAAAAHLQVDVGEVVDLVDQRLSVSAIVERPGDIHAEFIVGDPSTIGGQHDGWLVDTVSPMTWSDVQALNEHGITVLSKTVAADPPPSPVATGNGVNAADSIALIGIGALIVLEVVLLAGPAFAIGAKRRTREFGLMAANGATPTQIRRTILAGGLLLALTATTLGVAVGLLAGYVATPFLEGLNGMRTVGFGADTMVLLGGAAVAVTSGLLAAMVPAFTTSRQTVLALLTGRRGVRRSRRLWLVIGLLVAAAGAAATWMGITGTATAIPVGIILVELGLVLCTPSLVGLISKSARYLPLTPRLALRDAGRNRTAAAPVISAIMAVVAVGAALTMWFTSDRERFEALDEEIAEGTTVLALYADEDLFDNEKELLERSDQAEQTLTALATEHLPIGAVSKLYEARCWDVIENGQCQVLAQSAPDKACPYVPDNPYDSDGLSAQDQQAAREHPHCNETAFFGVQPLQGAFVLDDPTALTDVFALPENEAAEAVAVLEEGGILVGDPDLVDNGTVTVDIHVFGDPGTDAQVYSSVTAPGYAIDAPGDTILLGRHSAEQLDVPFERNPVLVGAPTDTPTAAQIEAFDGALLAEGLDPSSTTARPIIAITTIMAKPETEPLAPVMLVLSIITGFLALAATGVATALAAAESRRDLVTLGVIGASPGIRRRLSLCQAAVVSVLGTSLGVVVGVGFTAAVLAAQNVQLATRYPIVQPLPIDIPWPSVIVALIVVPAVAMLGAAVFTKSKIPSEHRVAG